MPRFLGNFPNPQVFGKFIFLTFLIIAVTPSCINCQHDDSNPTDWVLRILKVANFLSSNCTFIHWNNVKSEKKIKYFTAWQNCCWGNCCVYCMGKVLMRKLLLGKTSHWGNCCWGNLLLRKLMLGKLSQGNWEIVTREVALGK